MPAAQATHDAYFEPLSRLVALRGTRIVLGLLDDSDGVDGSLLRVDMARKHLPSIGVATVRGMGR